MTAIALAVLRHGPTDWSQSGRLQGHADRPLSDQGRRQVSGWRLPADLDSWRWFCSPLARARQTAALLGHPDAEPQDSLIEMDWGDWEGRSLAALRREDPKGMAEAEGRGLDLRPPGGESPRDLQRRLQPWLVSLAGRRQDSVAVCHKGVIRALVSLALDWDMTGEPPQKLRDGTCHRFLIQADGRPEVVRLNEFLVAERSPT